MRQVPFRMIGRRRMAHIRQAEVAECGLACLTMIAAFHGADIDLGAMRRRHAPSARGMTLRTLVAIADQTGFAARPVKLPLEALGNLHLPAILHWDLNHFVVLERVERGRAYILDPAAGAARRMPIEEVSKHFTGVALELRPIGRFDQVTPRQRLRLRALWGRMSGWKRAVAQTLALTIVLQVFALASPYYLQLALDNAVPALDFDLLAVLGLGFGGLMLFNVAASFLRSQVLLHVGTSVGYALTVNVAHRLFRLPVAWFERRHVGDVLSRFQSVHPIQDLLTQGVVAALVDGVLAVLTFALMLWYDPLLALIALAAFVLYVLLRFATFATERDLAEAAIAASAKEQSTLIESIRGIVTLRLFGREAERHIQWQNRLYDGIDIGLNGARLGIWQQSANALIFGIEGVASIWIAVHLVLSGGFSVGMVTAYLAYKQQFLGRVTSLIDQGIDLRMLRLHLDRLSDIVLEKEDCGFASDANGAAVFQGRISVRALCYRYAPTEPMILENLDLEVAPGDHIAIMGPSGGGKSTLARLILGLAEPEGGEILIDGQPLSRFGHRNYRAQIAAVLQDDTLFAGSIAQNIALFDDDADHGRIVEAAGYAAIHGEIEAMTMGYGTLVGDMGSSLSGGQKARVLLARALYRQPKLILLDEGTAHLDPDTEAAVNAAIAALGITRIVIAHRSETIRNADKVYCLSNGRLVTTGYEPG